MKYEKAPWTREERIILKKFYKNVPLAKLLELLPNRTESSVYSQVHYLRKRGWTFNE